MGDRRDSQLAGFWREAMTLMNYAAPLVAPPHPTFREAIHIWAKIGLLSLGGLARQIALMHRELVEERRWIR